MDYWGAKGYVGPPSKIIVGPHPPGPLFLRLCMGMATMLHFRIIIGAAVAQWVNRWPTNLATEFDPHSK